MMRVYIPPRPHLDGPNSILEPSLLTRQHQTLRFQTLRLEPLHLLLVDLISFRLLGLGDPSPVSVVLEQQVSSCANDMDRKESPGRETYLDVRAEHVVPPTETCRVATQDRCVVEIVVVGSSPEGENVTERPGEVVARVRVDCLEQPEADPDVDGEDVEVRSSETVEERSGDGPQREDQDFEGMGVLRSLDKESQGKAQRSVVKRCSPSQWVRRIRGGACGYSCTAGPNAEPCGTNNATCPRRRKRRRFGEA